MSPISSSDSIGKLSSRSVWSMVSHAEGRFNRLLSFSSWNGRKSIFQRRSLSKLYPFDPILLGDERPHLSPHVGVFWFGSSDRWTIAVDQSTSDGEIVLQVHQRRVLNGVGEVLELLDASIRCFDNPSDLGDASGFIRLLCRELTPMIEERRHDDV